MIKLQPFANEFAADITSVDVSQLSAQDFERIYAAWLAHGVVRIRWQRIVEAGLQTFSAQFGPLEEAPLDRMSEADKAKIKTAA